MTTLTKCAHENKMPDTVQVSVPKAWGSLMALIVMDDQKMPNEEVDVFMIRQFARLQFSSTTDLKSEYKRRFYEMCPDIMTREDLILTLTKRIYVDQNAPEKVWKELKNELPHEYAHRLLQTARQGDKIELPRGIWLIRNYKRKNHRVQCMETCYIYKDRYFDSLTEVAQFITGTQCSGPSFFKRKTEIVMDY